MPSVGEYPERVRAMLDKHAGVISDAPPLPVQGELAEGSPANPLP